MRVAGESPRFEIVPVEPESSSKVGAAAKGGAAFLEALKGMGGSVDRGEALIARATQGNLGALDSAQLIALQAGIYRYSEAVDLVAKLVDRATSAVKTVVSPH